MSFDKSPLDPKNPEAYFKNFKALQNKALDLQQAFLNTPEFSNSNNFAFFEDLQTKQKAVTALQVDLYEGVISSENLFSNAKNINSTHREYENSVTFSLDKEPKLKSMAENMKGLTSMVSKIPD